MPFPANWLEELVTERMDLEGFVISASISVPAGAGGRFSPDAVGAKLAANGRLLIRHCETAMHLIQGPKKEAAKYSAKFSSKIEQAVQTHFAQIFGAGVLEPVFETRVITFEPSTPVRNALSESISGLQIYPLTDFVLKEVLPAIERWREPPHTKTTSLPADKGLLHLIDWFQHCGLIPTRPQ